MWQFVANGLCKGAVYALLASGFALIYSTAKVFHIAHGAIYTLTAYTFYAFAVPLGWPLLPAAAVALLVGCFAGVLCETCVYKSLRHKGASVLAVMISSLGVYVMLVNGVGLVAGSEAKDLRLAANATFSVGSVVLSRSQAVQAAVSVIAVACYWILLQKTNMGRISRAVSDDPVLASVLGFRVELTRNGAFAIGSLLAGTAAILTALDIGVELQAGFAAFLVGTVACVIGGFRQPLAPAAGGLLLGVIQAIIVWRTSAKWEGAVTYGVLIVFLLFRPEGMLSISRRVGEQ